MQSEHPRVEPDPPGSDWTAFLLSNLGEAVCALDLDDRILFVNKAAARLLGRSEEQLVGMTQREAFGEMATEQGTRQHDARAAGEASTYELVLLDGEGGERTLLVTGSHLLDSEGRAVGSFGVLRDISERKRRERALELQLTLERTVSALARRFISCEDDWEAWTELLHGTCDLLESRRAVHFERSDDGWRLKNHWVQSDWEAFVPDWSELPAGAISRMVESLQRRKVLLIKSFSALPPAFQEERELAHRQAIDSALVLGVERAGRIESFVIFENPLLIQHFDRQEIPILEVLADVLSSSASRQRTESDRGMLFTAVEQNMNSILITDAQGRILYANPALERATGYTRRELLGRTTAIFDSHVHERSDLAEMDAALAAGHAWSGQLVSRRKDGSLLHESGTVSRMVDSCGRVSHHVAVMRDLSKERALETQLRQAQTLEAIGRLAAGVAHEINTPMQYVSDNLLFLQESLEDLLPVVGRCVKGLLRSESDEPDPVLDKLRLRLGEDDVDYLVEQLPQALEQSQEGLKRVTTIVQALKEFSHPGREGRSEVDINRAIESTVMVSRNEWKYVAETVLDLDPSHPTMLCHPGEFNQALLNLIINAAHAIAAADRGAPGTITVRSRVEGEGWLRVEIEDTGTGIPEEARAHVFEPFFTTKEVGRGTGQGLAITRNVIVEKHGGRIDFETTAGAGTVFRIWLPLDAERKENR